MGTELIRVAKGSVRGGFFLVSGTVMATIVMAIGTIVTARLLGPEFYGQYTLAFVFPQIIFIIADLGISQGIIKFTASLRSKGETQRVAGIVRTGLIIRASVGALLFLVTYALSGPIASVLLQRPELTFYLQIASISILFEAIFTTSISFFVGIDRSEFNALTTNIHATIKTIVSIALVLLGFGVIGAVVGYVSGFAVAAAVGLVILLVLLRDYKADSYDFTGDLKTLMRYGGPLYLSLMLIGIIPLYSNLILAFFETDVAIGNYKAAANFIQLLAAISIPITTSLLPAFSKLDSSAKDDIKTFFQHTVKYSTLIVLPLAVMMMLLADDVIQTIYGKDFQSAGIFLAAYCLIYFLVGFGSLTLPSFFNGLGKTRETLKMGLFTFIPMAVLSPLLAVAYGVLGLILGIVLGYAIGTFYGLYKARKGFSVDYLSRSTTKIYAIALGTGIPLLLFRFLPVPSFVSLVVGSFLYLLVYLTLLPLTGAITENELQTLTTEMEQIRFLGTYASLPLKYMQKILRRKEKT